ncbi:hypothetical protein [Sunxiuqinia dokdonensis]|uniref:Peptidase metallopeptidase domain-containing protein n=1 Tax=Sunxiuqinia dokdonensis TaxID=1409788 RepID=A0A0L8V4B5_9BACT|nr:hypothetical protein [Sunxiuqinia dokdonensis]KOH43330.1 hypothetical protein NC99_38900 [Sunxiuqinia dokdonensis]
MKKKILSIIIFPLSVFFLSCTLNENTDLSFLGNYNDKELEHFIMTGFVNEKFIVKWKSEMRIEAAGLFYEEDIKMIDDFIALIHSLVPKLPIMRVNSNGNVKVDFSDPPKGYSALTRRKWTALGYLYKCHVWISPINSGGTRKKLFYHEMMHVLGFDDPDPLIYHNGVLGFPPVKTFEERDSSLEHFELKELAKSAIEILYNENVKGKMNKRRFTGVIEHLQSQKCMKKPPSTNNVIHDQ